MPSAIVFGARNLGAAIARGLLADGYRVASVARTETDLDRLAGDGAVPVRADVTDPEALADAVARAAELVGQPDVLVNAVSLRPPDDGGPFGGGAIAEAPPSAFDAWAFPAARQAFLFLSAGARASRGARRHARAGDGRAGAAGGRRARAHRRRPRRRCARSRTPQRWSCAPTAFT